MQIVPLTGSHDRQQFDCAQPTLNDWLRQVARQHQTKGLSKTYVAVSEQDSPLICAYYALTLAELDSQHLPDAWRKKLPRRSPGVRLARLAVDVASQGRGLGTLLLIDALMRTQRIQQEAGGIGLFVDAIDAKAAGFYEQFGFQPAPDQPLLLYLPVQTLLT